MHHSFHENRNCLTCYSEVSNFLIVFSNCSLQVNGAFWISCKDCLPGDRELHNIGGAYFATFHKRSYCLNSYTLMSCANKWPRCSSEHAFYRLSGGRAGVAVCTFFPSTSQNSSLFFCGTQSAGTWQCVAAAPTWKRVMLSELWPMSWLLASQSRSEASAFTGIFMPNQSISYDYEPSRKRWLQ